MLAFRLSSKISLIFKGVIKSASRVRPSRSLAIMRDDKSPTGNRRIAAANGARSFIGLFWFVKSRLNFIPEHSKTTIARKHKRLIINPVGIFEDVISFQKTGESDTGGRF